MGLGRDHRLAFVAGQIADWSPVLAGFLHGAADRHGQAVAGEREQVERRSALGMRQIFVGFAMEMLDSEMLVDDDRSRAVAASDRPRGDVGELGPSCQRRPGNFPRRPGGEIDRARPRRAEPAVDAPAFRHGFEQMITAADGFGIAEEQVAALAKREMGEREDAVLRLGLEVDEEVAAADQVHPRIGRVGQQVLRREQDGFADVGLDPIIFPGPVEEALQPLGRHAFDHAGRGTCPCVPKPDYGRRRRSRIS